MKICPEPFEDVEIISSGEVYFCCAMHINKISIGNIYEKSFNDVWNSEFAIKFRKEVLNNSYKYCDSEICHKFHSQNVDFVDKTQNMNEKMSKWPVRVKLMHDYECNVNCIICRDKILRQPEENLKKLNEQVETIFLPMLKDARIVVLNAYGDPFASRNNIYLIKRICETYPDIKFEFHTNAILSSKEKLEELGVIDRIHKVVISLHAATKETYDKIVLNGNFEKALENTRLFARMHKEGKIEIPDVCFVVNSINYKEMQDFYNLIRKMGAQVFFWEFRKQGISLNPNYDELAVHLPGNKNHKDFLNVLKSLKFDMGLPYNSLHPLLEKLRMS